MNTPPPVTDAARCGVLIANLGTPDAPTASAIRRYLREFLSDPRVVEIPRLVWWPILYGVVLPLRPRKLVHAYGSIWTAQGSPLLAIGREQQAGLQRLLGDDIPVALGMRYGMPSLASALDELEQRGARRILVLPLYPQYSATTTASVFEAVFAALQRRRWMPELRLINDYHDDGAYIAALAASVRERWAQQGRGDHLLISFHSIPQRCCDLGDPYGDFCRQTAAQLARALALDDGQWTLSFQSRVGRAQWLSPYTEDTVTVLARQGVRRLDTIAPGFAADCLETLEELALRYGETFRQAGGEALRYIPALNARADHMSALASLLRRHLGGWENPETASDRSGSPT